MADELIDILSPEAQHTGITKMKSEAHRLGLFHASVHVWFYTKTKKLLLQKRASNKDTYPNLWDISVAGHVGAGEKPIQTAIREVAEEIGIAITQNELLPIAIYKSMKTPASEIIDNEFHHIYLCELKCNLDALVLQKEEVAAVQLISINKLQSIIKNTKLAEQYVPHGEKYFDKIFKALQQLEI